MRFPAETERIFVIEIVADVLRSDRILAPFTPALEVVEELRAEPEGDCSD